MVITITTIKETHVKDSVSNLAKSFGMWSDKVWIETHMPPKHWQQKKTVRGSYEQQQM